VDEAGVHPLLLAVGSERYTPYAKDDEPAELLTQSNAILGQGQMSLAKYLLIADEADRPPPLSDVRGFFRHVLERFEPARDLHFHVKTTIDTLDYSGTALNKGSKVVIAARGKKKRVLAEAVPEALGNHPRVRRAALVAPGIVAVETSPFVSPQEIDELGDALLGITKELSGVPLLVVVDDAAFTAKSFANFLWVTFTRSNPAVDVHGVGAFVENKAWGSRGPLLVDARSKPHHAPPLVENPEVTERVDRLFVRGGPLGRWG
jgi:4-hydroxy-3-polyprenylbenzoate decarboxylase